MSKCINVVVVGGRLLYYEEDKNFVLCEIVIDGKIKELSYFSKEEIEQLGVILPEEIPSNSKAKSKENEQYKVTTNDCQIAPNISYEKKKVFLRINQSHRATKSNIFEAQIDYNNLSASKINTINTKTIIQQKQSKSNKRLNVDHNPNEEINIHRTKESNECNDEVSVIGAAKQETSHKASGSQVMKNYDQLISLDQAYQLNNNFVSLNNVNLNKWSGDARLNVYPEPNWNVVMDEAAELIDAKNEDNEIAINLASLKDLAKVNNQTAATTLRVGHNKSRSHVVGNKNDSKNLNKAATTLILCENKQDNLLEKLAVPINQTKLHSSIKAVNYKTPRIQLANGLSISVHQSKADIQVAAAKLEDNHKALGSQSTDGLTVPMDQVEVDSRTTTLHQADNQVSETLMAEILIIPIDQTNKVISWNDNDRGFLTLANNKTLGSPVAEDYSIPLDQAIVDDWKEKSRSYADGAGNWEDGNNRSSFRG